MNFYDNLQPLQKQLSGKKHSEALLKELHTHRSEGENKLAPMHKAAEKDRANLNYGLMNS